MKRTSGWTFLSFKILPTTLKSSNRPLVQVPTKASSIDVPSTSCTGTTLSTECGLATWGTNRETSNSSTLSYRASSSGSINLIFLFDRSASHFSVFSSPSITPALAPTSIIILERVNLASILRSLMTSPPNSIDL